MTCEYRLHHTTLLVNTKLRMASSHPYRWVYINGILGIELGGVHKTAEQTIDLGRQAARRHFNITPGNVYTFDL